MNGCWSLVRFPLRNNTFIPTVSGEDSDPEMTEWENQQIRKGVTGAQLVSAQQESVYGQLLIMSGAITKTSSNSAKDRKRHDRMRTSTSPVSTGTKLEQAYARFSGMDAAHQLLTGGSQKSQTEQQRSGGPRMPGEVHKKLLDRLQQVRELHEKHVDEIEQMGSRLEALCVTEAENTQNAPVAAVKFRFYQELRGYVTDLVECLDEKLPAIVELERKALGIMARQAQLLIERRRQDVRDQAKEIAEAGSECSKRYGLINVARIHIPFMHPPPPHRTGRRSQNARRRGARASHHRS